MYENCKWTGEQYEVASGPIRTARCIRYTLCVKSICPIECKPNRSKPCLLGEIDREILRGWPMTAACDSVNEKGNANAGSAVGEEMLDNEILRTITYPAWSSTT